MKRFELVLLGSVSAMIWTSPALAQEAPAPQASENRTEISDIVVTAERVARSEQKTPISMKVYEEETLRERGVRDYRALQNIDSSIQIPTASAGLPTLTIRGITSTNVSQTGEPANPIATDGIFNNRGYIATAGFFDVERIEVLRGPQGTLFGRNTTGGLVNVITNKPQDTFSARVTAEVGNYETLNVDGYINVPVADRLAMRFAFMSRNRDGFSRDTMSDRRGNDDDVVAARAQIQWEPVEGLTLWASASATREAGLGGVGQSIPFAYPAGTPVNPTTGVAINPGTEWLHTLPAGTSPTQRFDHFGILPQRIVTHDFKWQVSYDNLPLGMSLVYIGGYNKIDYRRAINSIFRNTRIAFTRYEHPETLQNEVRLVSAPGRFTFQIGAYIFEEDSNTLVTNVRNPGAGAPQEAEYYQFDDPKITADSKAMFGQASFEIVDGLKLTGGLRYTWDKKYLQEFFRIRPIFTGAPVTITQTTDASYKSEKATWLVGLDYQATPDNLFYAKVSTGYKAGSLNNVGTWRPESITAYEIGTKNRLFDNRVQLNLAGYYMDYRDQHVTTYVMNANNIVVQTTTNAGKSEIYGIEANLLANIGDFGRLDISANALHAEYKQFVSAASWSASPPRPVTLLDLSGNRLPNSPRFTISAQYEHTIHNAFGGEISGLLGIRYQTGQYYGQENFPDQYQKGYALVDASVIYRSKDGWSIQPFVRNVFDKKYYTNLAETAPFGVYSITASAPRTYGVRFSAGF